jgi:transcriptional regulator with XRE-family HTH domain
MTDQQVSNIDGTAFKAQEPPRLSPSTLKRARILLGLSQDDLARKVGLTGSSICNFETGRTRWRPRNECKLIDCFAQLGIDLIGDRLVLRPPRRLAAAD